MKNRYYSTFCVLTLIAVFSTIYYGCSSNKGSSPATYNVSANLNVAWASFRSGDYDAALGKFSDILSHAADNKEALMGRGWCHAFRREYSDAIMDFNSSLQQSPNTDAEMGLSSVYRDLPDLQAAIANASSVIAADSDYVFVKKTSIDFKDAHLIKAQCYFRLGKNSFPFAHVEVSYLCSLLGVPLLPAANTLLAVEYEKQLARKLEDLSARIRD